MAREYAVAFVAAVFALGCAGSKGDECTARRGEECPNGVQLASLKSMVVERGRSVQLSAALQAGTNELRVGATKVGGSDGVDITEQQLTVLVNGVEAERLPTFPDRPRLFRFVIGSGQANIEVALSSSAPFDGATLNFNAIDPTATCTVCAL